MALSEMKNITSPSGKPDDENATDMPAFIRFMLRRVIKAPEFLSLDIVSELPAA